MQSPTIVALCLRNGSGLFLAIGLLLSGCHESKAPDGGNAAPDASIQPDATNTDANTGGTAGSGGVAGMGGEAGAGGQGGEGGVPNPEACAHPERVTMRRLNRSEYDNTVRDLLGNRSRPGRDFPEDDIGEGFDNIGDVLSVSTLHVEKYEAAAKSLAEAALPLEGASIRRFFEAEEIGSDVGAPYQGEYWNLWSNGALTVDLNLPATGQYEIRIRAFGQQAGDAPAQMSVSMDGGAQALFDVDAVQDNPDWYTYEVTATAGPHILSVGFVNDFVDEATQQDRNLVIDVIMVEGPMTRLEVTEQSFEAEAIGSNVGEAAGEFWNLWHNGSIQFEVEFPGDGLYSIRVRAYAIRDSLDYARMVYSMDGVEVGAHDVEVGPNAPAWHESRIPIEGGLHILDIAFVNDYVPNLFIDVIVVEGPFAQVESDPEQENSIMVCQPEDDDDLACARQIVTQLARRAWRRPIEARDVDRMMVLVEMAREEGDPLRKGIQLALRALLLSPHFIYRIEVEPTENDDTRPDLSDHQLATRLSYFLWSTMPDEQLFAHADNGSLSDPLVLDGEIERMLQDPKSKALVDNFAGQWLQVRGMDDVIPDPDYFPDFDESLRASMKLESLLFFERFLRSNLPVNDMVNAPFTFINTRLANHYGLEHASGIEGAGMPRGFREVDLTETNRAGLMTMGSLLTVTSYPNRTSPVKRGKWILEQLMCDAPPPPPPDVEGELGAIDAESSLRERLEQHRADPQCAACHRLMDPIGLGMENYDGIGAHRTMEGDLPIDSSGVLPNGVEFNGALALGDLLAEDPRLVRCVHRKMLTYAIGHGLHADELCHVDEIVESTASEQHRLADIVRAIIHSDAFTTHGVQREAP